MPTHIMFSEHTQYIPDSNVQYLSRMKQNSRKQKQKLIKFQPWSSMLAI